MATNEQEFRDFFAEYWGLRQVGFLLTGDRVEADEQSLPQARVRVAADGGASTTRALPPYSVQDRRILCQPDASWTIAPVP